MNFAFGAEVFRVRTERPGIVLAADAARGIVAATVQGHGSAVAVGEHELLTAAHVVAEGAVSVELSGAWTRAEVVKRDAEADLALLRVPLKLKYHKLARDSRLTAWASDRGKPVSARPASFYRLLIACAAENGNSGGAVLNDDGELAAVIYARQDSEPAAWAVCVPACVIREFLR